VNNSSSSTATGQALNTAVVSVRRLTPTDAPAYWPLRLRALREHADAFTSSFEEESLRPPSYAEARLGSKSTSYFWGAFFDDALVGMVGLDFEQRVKNKHKGTVIGMYVAPEFAGHGVGRALLDALLAAARAQALEMLILTVTHGNHSAEKLYINLGFQSFGIEPNAIKVQGKRFAKNHMYLSLSSSA
jgi:ribosomal protein S18 acetylase RimI-like enzyme